MPSLTRAVVPMFLLGAGVLAGCWPDAVQPSPDAPPDGFFDPAATYFGATPSAGLTGALIPWYAGWTVGF